MRAAVADLAACLDEAVAVQERLLELVNRQRPAIVGARHAEIDVLAAEIETEVRRLAAAERGRARAAETLADDLGLAATRWSALREAVEPSERAALAPRVERLEALVRDLELANAVNGQLVRHELELVDMSMRSRARPERAAAHAYTAAGGVAAAPAAAPVLLNTAA